MEEYGFPEMIYRRVAEHEVYIAFNNDSGAVLFHEWWHTQGKNSFETFLAKEERKGRD
jgi:hypothetical protein